ncbi:hypothetical protein GV829_04500 [Sphingomonas lacunae]|uniref:Uncharacterized protein n=1 Tax=Sphingomonas lacunae TaxID=2698828 RepID=A0A6M4ARW5_9SPHN|nr:hypothetical protein [Sphingomonas lacunae]QJQ31795.1 hypothetical protein GV829_04500 [Sphingomonas lacunae]
MPAVIHDLFQMLNWYACGAIFGGAWMAVYQRPATVVLVKHRLWDKLEAIAQDLHSKARFVGSSEENGSFIIQHSGTVETDQGALTIIIQKSTGKVDHD